MENHSGKTQTEKEMSHRVKDYWKGKLTAFDAQFVRMCESLSGKDCEPKNGGEGYFVEVDYSRHNDDFYIAAIMDAINGRLGERLIRIKDDPDRECLIVFVKFADAGNSDAAFIPKHYEEG